MNAKCRISEKKKNFCLIMKPNEDRKRNAPVGFGLKDHFFENNDNKRRGTLRVREPATHKHDILLLINLSTFSMFLLASQVPGSSVIRS